MEKPKAGAPESPIHSLAGCQLCGRNPSDGPASAKAAGAERVPFTPKCHSQAGDDSLQRGVTVYAIEEVIDVGNAYQPEDGHGNGKAV